jgi:outer membrane protein OmpA-like peptidoglycan-associated protein
VRATLIAVGIPANAISVAGRGEHDLAVQTADQVPEPRNRRAEIKIR